MIILRIYNSYKLIVIFSLSKALDMHIAVALLRMAENDYKDEDANESQKKTKLPPNLSFSQLSQGKKNFSTIYL